MTAFFVTAAAQAKGVDKDLERAKEALLRGSRQEALKILIEAKPKLGQEKSAARLREVFEQIAETFITDKGQKLYELAMANPSPSLARRQAEEGLQVEGPNVLLVTLMVNLDLAEARCPAAQTTITANQEYYQDYPLFAALTAQTNYCSGKTELADEFIQSQEKVISKLKPAGAYLLAKSWMTNDRVRSLDLLVKAEREDPQFPEIYWLKSQIAQSGYRDIEKYLALCRNLNTSVRKRYLWEPRLCSSVNEAESELKKLKAEERSE